MADWMAQRCEQERRRQLEAQQELHAEEQGAELDYDEDEDEGDTPPPEFYNLVSQMLSSASRSTAMRAWDRTKAMGRLTGAFSPENMRVQAALDLVFELHPPTPPHKAPSPPPAQLHQPIAGPPPAEFLGAPPPELGAAAQIEAQAFPGGPHHFVAPNFPPIVPPLLVRNATPIFAAPPPFLQFGDLAIQNHAFEPVVPPNLPASPPRPAEAFLATGIEREKGKGKAREVIEIDSDSDDDVIAVPGPGPRAQAKAGARGGVNFLNLSSDDEVIQVNRKKYEDEDGDVQILDSKGKAKENGKLEMDERDLTPMEIDLGPAQLQAQEALVTQSAFDLALLSVITILPDVLPSYALSLLQKQEAAGVSLTNGAVEAVLEALFLEDGYPKVEVAVSKKRERSVDLFEDDETGRNFLQVEGRMKLGVVYESAALASLFETFELVPKNIVRKVFQEKGSFFAPAYIALQGAVEEQDVKKRGFTLNKVARSLPKGKGKEVPCPDFERENGWILKYIRKEDEKKNEAGRLQKAAEEEVARGEFFECGCCFGETGFSLVVCCLEGHYFCRECVEQQVNTQIGQSRYTLPCMNTDGCTSSFPETQIAYLPAKTLELLEKLKTQRSVEMAEIDGLAKCPFCPYAYIIENKEEKLFNCQKEDCLKVSCLQCKRESHLPKSCAEVDADNKIDIIHRIEEAMSEALIRKCPKCSEPYVKEDGCNKITCPKCGTLSCYICRDIIRGYEHFVNAGPNAKYTEKGATCLLWDDSKKRNADDVEAARKEHAAAVAQENPALNAEDLAGANLVAPAPPPAPPNVAPLPHAQPPGRLVARQYNDPRAQQQMAALREEAMERARVRVVQMQAQVARERDVRQRLLAEQMRRAREETERQRESMRRQRAQEEDAKAARRDRLKKKK
ncbi:hypothetical protein T439DRAFT_322072 [Meredithblackwellia eburnea MCA 4105]